MECDVVRVAVLAVALSIVACNGGPTEPRAMVIADGRWTGDGACLMVRSSPNISPHTSTLIAGCGHGEFPTPDIRNDGTFDVEGTYRIEAGPISNDPPPAARYSGSLTNTTLTLVVTPSLSTITPATFRLHMDPGGTCPGPACL